MTRPTEKIEELTEGNTNEQEEYAELAWHNRDVVDATVEELEVPQEETKSIEELSEESIEELADYYASALDSEFADKFQSHREATSDREAVENLQTYL